MRFALKIVCAAVLVVALSLALGATMLIQTSFMDSLEREKERVLSEHALMKLGFETASVTYAIQGIELDGSNLPELVEQLGAGRQISLLDADRNLIYGSITLPEVFGDVTGARELTVQREGENTYIYVDGLLSMSGNAYEILLRTDITQLYKQREAMTRNFLNIFIIVLLISAALIFAISMFLAMPIIRLARISRRIAKGAYDLRAPESGGDEVAEFTHDFNLMTQALNDKLEELELAVEQRENFVANFAHELKTPLTSIIGYADVLRSQELSQEKVFRSANTIFSEGRRLEALSIKLLELIVVGKQEIELKRINPRLLAADLGNSLQPLLVSQSMVLRIRVQDSILLGEPDLLKTLLYNLLDNARKASQPGTELLLHGIVKGNKYIFSVVDRGRGIPPEELGKITQAFYMVDKSRARAQNGAGLGLALCEKIANLHGSNLEISSGLGRGTTVRFSMEVAAR